MLDTKHFILVHAGSLCIALSWIRNSCRLLSRPSRWARNYFLYREPEPTASRLLFLPRGTDCTICSFLQRTLRVLCLVPILDRYSSDFRNHQRPTSTPSISLRGGAVRKTKTPFGHVRVSASGKVAVGCFRSSASCVGRRRIASVRVTSHGSNGATEEMFYVSSRSSTISRNKTPAA